jgi:ubiquitin C-terminal hydrolase
MSSTVTSVTERKKPTGYVNLGNTCFLNTALQILASCSKFQEHLSILNVPQSSHCNDSQDFLREYLIFHRLSKNIANPHKLIGSLGKLFKQYNNCEQEDTNECILRTIDIIEKALKSTQRRNNKPGSPVIKNGMTPGDVLRCFSLYAWKVSMYNKSVATSMFYGQMRTVITCRRCKQERNSFADFNSLPIIGCDNVHSGIVSIQEIEYIDGVECEKCKTHTKIKKQSILWKLPRILLFLFPAKDLKSVACVLKLSDNIIHKTNDVSIETKKYELKAIGCHDGTYPSGGHYYAYVKYSDNWFLANDDLIERVDVPSNLDNKIYNLMYERV